jgi:hypothetical protein
VRIRQGNAWNSMKNMTNVQLGEGENYEESNYEM